MDHMDHNHHDMSMMDMTTTTNSMPMTTGGDHSMHNMDMNHGGDTMGGMMMIMHAGFRETIVFPGWVTKSAGAFVGSCIALFLISIAYEALKLVREKLTRSKLIALRRQMHVQDTNESEKKLQIEERVSEKCSYKKKLISVEHIIQTFLHVLQFAISYFLMLAIMTYNWWICLSILLGIGVGFYFFGTRRSRIDLNEDCH